MLYEKDDGYSVEILIQVTFDVIWIFRCHIFVLFVMAELRQWAGELVIFLRLHQEWLLQDSTAVQVRVLQQLLVSMYYQKSKYSKSWYNQNLSVISYSNFSIIYYSKPQKAIKISPKTDISQIHVFYKKIIFKRAKNSILVYFLFKSGLRPYHGHQVIRFYSTQRCLTSRVGHLAGFFVLFIFSTNVHFKSIDIYNT